MSGTRSWCKGCMAIAVIALAGVAATAAADGDGAFTGEVNFVVGGKFLDEQDWFVTDQAGNELYSLDSHVEFGVEMSWGKTDWPVLIATDVMWSFEESSSGADFTDAWTAEVDLGARKIWARGRVQPYAGAGLGFFFAGINLDCNYYEIPLDNCVTTTSDKEAAVGLWINGGVNFRLGGKFNLGATARWSYGGDMDIFGRDRSPGGFHLGAFVGFGWPKYE